MCPGKLRDGSRFVSEASGNYCRGHTSNRWREKSGPPVCAHPPPCSGHAPTGSGEMTCNIENGNDERLSFRFSADRRKRDADACDGGGEQLRKRIQESCCHCTDYIFIVRNSVGEMRNGKEQNRQ